MEKLVCGRFIVRFRSTEESLILGDVLHYNGDTQKAAAACAAITGAQRASVIATRLKPDIFLAACVRG
jgi:hypothetical protein